MSGSFAIASYAIASGSTQSVAASPSVPVPISIGLSSCFHGTTAGDVIRRALGMILVDAADSVLQPDEYQSGLDVLNSYMADLEGNGVRLGYQTVCNISDTVTVPDAAIRGIAANIAIDLAPMFGGRITAALLKQAQDGEKTLYRLGVQVGTSMYPSTMPFESVYANQRWTFFEPIPFAVMNLAANRRVTTISTASTAELVQGVWGVQDFYSLTPDIGGKIVNNGEGRTVKVYAEFNLKASGTTSGGVIVIARNNSVELYVEDIALTTSPVSALVEGDIAMEAGDFLSVYVANTANTFDITVIDALVKVN